METIIVTLISVLFGAGGFFAFMYERKDKLNKVIDILQTHTGSIDEIKNKVNLLGDESIQTLRYSLHRYYKQFVYQGRITTQQLGIWNESFETYKALGGNHEVHVMNEVIQKLPVDDSFEPVSPYEVGWRQAYDHSKKEKEEQ